MATLLARIREEVGTDLPELELTQDDEGRKDTMVLLAAEGPQETREYAVLCVNGIVSKLGNNYELDEVSYHVLTKDNKLHLDTFSYAFLSQIDDLWYCIIMRSEFESELEPFRDELEKLNSFDALDKMLRSYWKETRTPDNSVFCRAYLGPTPMLVKGASLGNGFQDQFIGLRHWRRADVEKRAGLEYNPTTYRQFIETVFAKYLNDLDQFRKVTLNNLPEALEGYNVRKIVPDNAVLL